MRRWSKRIRWVVCVLWVAGFALGMANFCFAAEAIEAQPERLALFAGERAMVEVHVFGEGVQASQPPEIFLSSSDLSVVRVQSMERWTETPDGLAGQFAVEAQGEGDAVITFTLRNGGNITVAVRVVREDIPEDTGGLILYAGASYFDVPLVYDEGQYINQGATIHFYVLNSGVTEETAEVSMVRISLPPNLALDTGKTSDTVHFFQIAEPFSLARGENWGILFDVTILAEGRIDTVPITVEILGENFTEISRILLLPVFDAGMQEEFPERLGRHELYAQDTFDFLFTTEIERTAGRGKILDAVTSWLMRESQWDVPFAHGAKELIELEATRYDAPVTLVLQAMRIGEGGGARYEFDWHLENIPPYDKPIALFGLHEGLLKTYQEGFR